MRQSDETTASDSRPAWPILVIDEDVSAYDEDWWYGDADLCAAGIWTDRAEVIDSLGRVFLIEHRVIRKARWLGIIPYAEVENVFVPNGRTESADTLLHRLREHPNIPQPILNECIEIASTDESDDAIRRIVLVIYSAA